MFLAELLEAMGHEVCESVTNAAALVEAAERCLPDLMIVDRNLGQSDGVSAVANILRTRFVPHIFVTGDVYRLGADHAAIVLQKPFSLRQLECAITRSLAAKPARDRER